MTETDKRLRPCDTCRHYGRYLWLNGETRENRVVGSCMALQDTHSNKKCEYYLARGSEQYYEK